MPGNTTTVPPPRCGRGLFPSGETGNGMFASARRTLMWMLTTTHICEGQWRKLQTLNSLHIGR